jgi:hypothetical protein
MSGEEQEVPAIEKNLVWVDTEELVCNSPACEIPNPDTYADLEAGFNPLQWDPPQVSAVYKQTPEGISVVLSTTDGHTRLAYARDNIDTTYYDWPDWSFDQLVVNDVTEPCLNNPRIVLPRERGNGQEALEPKQHARAIVPHVKSHTKIVELRIASHLIHAWENMAGEDVAVKFSALAALNTLGRWRSYRHEGGVNDYIDRQQELVVGETDDERSRLRGALIEMAEIIDETGLSYNEVAQEALALTSIGSPAIGGETEAARQLLGLLHAPVIEDKLAKAYPGIEETGIREQARLRLGRRVVSSFQRFSTHPESEKVLSKLEAVLRSTDLNLEDIFDIYKSDQPITRTTEIRQGLRGRKFRVNYLDVVGREELTASEDFWIDKMASELSDRWSVRRSMVRDYLAPVVQDFSKAVDGADGYMAQLSGEQDDLIEQGVAAHVIESALRKVADSRDNVTSSDVEDLTNAKRRVGHLKLTLRQVREDIQFQRGLHRAGEIIDSVGLPAKRAVLQYLTQKIPDLNEEGVRDAIGQLSRLDEGLQLKVIGGDVELVYAFQQQEAGLVPYVPATEVVEIPVASETPTTEAEEAFIPEREEVDIDKREYLEGIAQAGQRFAEQAYDFNSSITQAMRAGLNSKNLPEEAKTVGIQVIRRLGGVVLGRGFDVVEIVEVERPKLLKTIARLQEERVQREIDETTGLAVD